MKNFECLTTITNPLTRTDVLTGAPKANRLKLTHDA
jgi:hypothetical protein